MERGHLQGRSVPYRDELEALQARLKAAEEELARAREEGARLKSALAQRDSSKVRDTKVLRTPSPRWVSVPGGEPTPVTIVNESRRKIEIFWLSYEGRERSAGTLVPGGRIRTQTYVGHCWRFVDAGTGEILAHERVQILAGEPLLAYDDADTERLEGEIDRAERPPR
jgi:hypothetical protein